MKNFQILLLFVFAFDCNNNELKPGFPENDHLLKISQSWGKDSEFGLLPEKNLEEEDLELRMWSGFGIRGDKGVIINRTNGHWFSSSIEIRTCVVLSYQPRVSDSLKSTITIDKEFTNELNCTPEIFDDIINRNSQYTDSLFVTQLQTDLQYEKLWKNLKSEGILNLPTEVDLSEPLPDEHSYVVEIKKGNVYRAFVTGNESRESNLQVQRIAQIIDSYLNTSIDGRTW